MKTTRDGLELQESRHTNGLGLRVPTFGLWLIMALCGVSAKAKRSKCLERSTSLTEPAFGDSQAAAEGQSPGAGHRLQTERRAQLRFLGIRIPGERVETVLSRSSAGSGSGSQVREAQQVDPGTSSQQRSHQAC